ncbi:uncharacterized protein [Symphalangus syndactylus]|uniref:uncharacterized protein n=1 Tax=Symphalangus syndactylus TaxID=9590 RepID=UPI003007456D
MTQLSYHLPPVLQITKTSPELYLEPGFDLLPHICRPDEGSDVQLLEMKLEGTSNCQSTLGLTWLQRAASSELPCEERACFSFCRDCKFKIDTASPAMVNSMSESSCCSTSLPAFGVISTLDFSHSYRIEAVKLQIILQMEPQMQSMTKIYHGPLDWPASPCSDVNDIEGIPPEEISTARLLLRRNSAGSSHFGGKIEKTLGNAPSTNCWNNLENC